LEIEDSCPELEYLSAYNNEIEEVDLSYLGNLKVVNLSCNETKDSGLRNINLAGCYELQELYVSNNDLQDLDLFDNKKLRILYCSYNPISELFVKNLENLKVLHCESCCLRSLNCGGLEKLKELYCFDNE
jgi:Leucine-rich repeat (LRR) protein